MTQPLTELVDQFCNFQRKQRGKTEGGVRAYRWNLEQFLVFIRNRDARLARVTDLTASTVQAWMDDMAAEDLALSTMRVRQSTLISCWMRTLLTRSTRIADLQGSTHHERVGERDDRSDAPPS